MFRSRRLELLRKIDVILLMRKSLKNSISKVHIFSYGAGYRPAMLIKTNSFPGIFQRFFNYFLGNLSELLPDFQNNYLKNILGWLLPCAISNQTKENFATWEHMVFIYIKLSIGRDHVHTISDSFSCWHKILSDIMWTPVGMIRHETIFLIFLFTLKGTVMQIRGGSRVRPLKQMTKSHFLPMKC